jgi:hypothetical protein
MSVRSSFLESLNAALLGRIVEDWLVVLPDNGLHVEPVVPVKSATIGMPDERLEELSTPCIVSTLLALVPSTTSLYVKDRTTYHQMSNDKIRNRGYSLVRPSAARSSVRTREDIDVEEDRLDR